MAATAREKNKNGVHALIHDPRISASAPQDPFQESVYRLIPEEVILPAKEQRYKSVYADKARVEYKNKQKERSMGPPKVQLASPKEFLHKGKGVPKKDISKSQKDKSVRKAPIPHEPGPKLAPTKKNFITQNALDNINSLPKQLKNRDPSFLEKKDYGRVPEYLQKRISEIKKEELEKANRMAMEQQEAQNQALVEQGIVPLPDEERLRILNGLKENWEKLNQDYQRLSLTVDTVPKIARKVNMEQQLKQYEELIDRFSNTNIHVNFNSQ